MWHRQTFHDWLETDGISDLRNWWAFLQPLSASNVKGWLSVCSKKVPYSKGAPHAELCDITYIVRSHRYAQNMAFDIILASSPRKGFLQQPTPPAIHRPTPDLTTPRATTTHVERNSKGWIQEKPHAPQNSDSNTQCSNRRHGSSPLRS